MFNSFRAIATLRYGWLVACLMVSIVSAALGTIPTVGATPSFNDPSFAQTWQRIDQPVENQAANLKRGYTWGPALGPAVAVTGESYNGITRTVQYFDKARMELNTKNTTGDPLWNVTTGLLVEEMMTGRRQDGDTAFSQVAPSAVQVAGDSNDGGANAVAPTYASFGKLTTTNYPVSSGQLISAVINHNGEVSAVATPPEKRYLKSYDSVTGHNIADVFVDFGNLSGPLWMGSGYQSGPVFFGTALYVLGRPLTEPYWTRAVVAGTERDVLVQLFERRSLTYTPSNPDPYKVEMGNVGQHYYKWRYQDNPTPVVTTPGESASDNEVKVGSGPALWAGLKNGVLSDVSYCQAGTVNLKMDMYFPANFQPGTGPARPVVFYLHGGGWTTSDKSDANLTFATSDLQKNGVVVLAPNYRLAPDYQFPAPLEDVRCAMRFLKVNAAAFGLDASRVGILADSAGAQLAGLLVLTGSQANAPLTPGTAHPDPAIKAVVDLYGTNDLSQPDLIASLQKPIQEEFGTLDPAKLRLVSPVAYLPAASAKIPLPAFLLMHGDKDTTVPPNQSQMFYNQLKAAGADATLQIVPGAAHGFKRLNGLCIPRNWPLADQMTAFLTGHLGAPTV